MDKISLDNLVFLCPVELSCIEELFMEITMNIHAIFKIKGILPPDNYEKARRIRLLGKSFKLSYSNDGEEIPLFYGLIHEVKMEQEGGLHRLSITGYSMSISFDKDKKTRFFQDKRLTYGKIMNKIAGKGRVIHSIACNGETIPYPLLQYEETDWDFIKRLAGHLNTVLITDVQSGYPQLAIGLPQGAVHDLICTDKYTVRRCSSIHNSMKQSANKMAVDRFCTVSCAKDMNLGDTVEFLNQTWIVYRKKVVLANGLLEPEYELRDKENIGVPFIYHMGIQGLDLDGEVMETSGESVKIRTNYEEEHDVEYIFSYLYLPETGNLFYSMPEPGAKVRLHFPLSIEQGCFIINSKSNHKIEYPDAKIKIMRTPKGKSLFITPKILRFIASERKKTISVCMDDTKGINFTSPKRIRIKAGKNVRIRSHLSCMLTSDCLISAEQNNTENRIDIYGNIIRMSADQYLFSTAMRKAMRSKEPEKIDYAACAALYGYAIGAIPIDVTDKKNAVALAAIPTVCNADGPATIAGYIGWRSGKD